MTEYKLDELERCFQSNPSLHSLQALFVLRNEAIAALSDELKYANIEFNTIDSLISQNRSLACFPVDFSSSTRSYSNGSDKNERSDIVHVQTFGHLLTYGSREHLELEHRWKHELNDSIKSIRKSLHKEADKSLSSSDLDDIYESISRIQNAYFQAVENRENNRKLWLRLKMHTGSRLKSLDEIIRNTHPSKSISNDHTSFIATISPTKFSTNFHTLDKHPSKHSSDGPYEIGSNSSSKFGLKGCMTLEEPSTAQETTANPCNGHNSSIHFISKDPNVTKLLILTDSLDEYKVAARSVFQKYANKLMPYKVLTNVIEFLIKSLNLNPSKNIQVENILNAFNISPGFHIDLRTFTLMYWEVIHTVRTVVEAMDCVNYDIWIDASFLNYYNEDELFINIKEHFNFVKKLSAGKSCTKYLAQELDTGEFRVVEFICKSPKIPKFDEIISEFGNLKMLGHQNLVRYISIYHDYNTIYIISEFCSGLSLTNRLQLVAKGTFEYSLAFVHSLFTQTIEALVYLNCNNISHKCLTLDKIMFVDSGDLPQIKLRDYGLFDIFGNDATASFFTNSHLSPEAINGRTCKESDVWSLGAILYFLLTAQMPTENVKSSDFRQHLRITLSNSQVFSCDNDVIDLVCGLLSSDLNDRPTPFEILTHPWYTKTDIPKVLGSSKYFTTGLNDLMRRKEIKRTIVRIFESQELFCVDRIKKVEDTIKLTASTDDVLEEDLRRILILENIPEDLTARILGTLSIRNEKTCAVQCLKTAFKTWTLGEINLLWSKFSKHCNKGEWSMETSKFIELLRESKSLLVTQSKISKLCRCISLEDKIYWNHFVQLFY